MTEAERELLVAVADAALSAGSGDRLESPIRFWLDVLRNEDSAAARACTRCNSPTPLSAGYCAACGLRERSQNAG